MAEKEFSEKMKFLKDTENGRRELSGLRKKIFDEGREEERENVILSMLRDDLSFKFISKYCGYSEQKIKELRNNFVKKGLLPS